MKRSARNAEPSSDEDEPLDATGDAAKPTQDLEPKRQRGEDLGDDGEGSFQGASGVALESTQAGLGLESCHFQDVSRDDIQANREVAAQPTEAGLGLEFHNFQEQPNVEEFDIQASSDAAIQLTQAGSRLELLEQPNVEEGSTHPICGVDVQPMQADLGLESQNSQEQPNIEEEGGVWLQPAQVALPSPLVQGNDTLQTLTDEQNRFIVDLAQSVSCNTNNPRNVQAGTPHPEEETGSNEGSVPQTPPLDIDDLGAGGQDVISHQEEEEEGAGIYDTIGLQLPPFDMEDPGRADWIELADLDEPMDPEEDIVIQALVGEQEMQGLDEPVDDEADSGIQVQVGQPIQMRECMVNAEEVLGIEEVLSIDDLNDILQDITGDETPAQLDGFIQAMNNQRNVQAGASHPEEETGNNDGSVPRTSPSGQGETSHQVEEEAGLNDIIGPQASPVDLNNPMDDDEDILIQAQAGQQQVQGVDESEVDEPEEDTGIQIQAGQQQMPADSPPQQGTAGRRMHLQVPLCGAEGPIEQSVFGLPQVRELACLVECI